MILLLGPRARTNTDFTHRLPSACQSLSFNDDMAAWDGYRWRSATFLRCQDNDLSSYSRHIETDLSCIQLYLKESYHDWDHGAIERFENICSSFGIERNVKKMLRTTRREYMNSYRATLNYNQ